MVHNIKTRIHRLPHPSSGAKALVDQAEKTFGDGGMGGAD
jgi:hypothetical protein